MTLSRVKMSAFTRTNDLSIHSLWIFLIVFLFQSLVLNYPFPFKNETANLLTYKSIYSITQFTSFMYKHKFLGTFFKLPNNMLKQRWVNWFSLYTIYNSQRSNSLLHLVNFCLIFYFLDRERRVKLELFRRNFTWDLCLRNPSQVELG